MTAIEKYLTELDELLLDVDPAIRDGLVNGIREELAGMSDADAAERLRAIGDPAFVAASARAELSQPKAARRNDPAWYSVATVLLGSIGGFLIPVLGSIIGLVMLWMAANWQLRHKVVGTVLTALGSGGVFLMLVPFYTVATVTVSGAGDNPNPLIPAAASAPWSAILFFALAVAWFAGWIWLLVVAERARRR